MRFGNLLGLGAICALTPKTALLIVRASLPHWPWETCDRCPQVRRRGRHRQRV